MAFFQFYLSPGEIDLIVAVLLPSGQIRAFTAFYFFYDLLFILIFFLEIYGKEKIEGTYGKLPTDSFFHFLVYLLFLA
jgi:hypothetical protein